MQVSPAVDGDVEAQFNGLEKVGRGKRGVYCSHQAGNGVSKLSQSFQVHHTHGWVSWTLSVQQL